MVPWNSYNLKVSTYSSSNIFKYQQVSLDMHLLLFTDKLIAGTNTRNETASVVNHWRLEALRRRSKKQNIYLAVSATEGDELVLRYQFDKWLSG